MPGVLRLAGDLGVDHKTVMAAVRVLEEEGVLVYQGRGKPRLVVPDQATVMALRIAMLEYDAQSQNEEINVALREALREQGHTLVRPRGTLTGLGFHVPKLRSLVKRTEADAWIVAAGPRELLEWMQKSAPPTFALFGRFRGLQLAGGGLAQSALREVVERLVGLGHRRVVWVAREERRIPFPGAGEQLFLDELRRRDIPVGSYNLPDWEDSPEGLARMLDSLFRTTPPTALLVDDPGTLLAPVRDFLAHRRLRVPEDLSLIALGKEPGSSWCIPPVAHVVGDTTPIVRRVVDWINNVSRGRPDVKQVFPSVSFIEGGTVGPAAG